LRVARRRRAERFYACGALQLFRAARSTRTLGVNPGTRMTLRTVLVSSLLALATAGCDADSTPAAPVLTLEAAGELLAHESGRPVRKFSTRDFGREQFSGAQSVLVPEDRALELLDTVRARLGPGLVAFIGTQDSLADPPAVGVEVVVAPGDSQFDILRVAASDAINYDMGTEDLIRELQTWDHEFGIDIYAAQTDVVQMRLTKMPSDLKHFAGRVYEFCPDIVDQGTETVDKLAKYIADSQEVYLWWD
jgi:hypothetical protein